MGFMVSKQCRIPSIHRTLWFCQGVPFSKFGFDSTGTHQMPTFRGTSTSIHCNKRHLPWKQAAYLEYQGKRQPYWPNSATNLSLCILSPLVYETISTGDPKSSRGTPPFAGRILSVWRPKSWSTLEPGLEKRQKNPDRQTKPVQKSDQSQAPVPVTVKNPLGSQASWFQPDFCCKSLSCFCRLKAEMRESPSRLKAQF